jgi:hypothetical protein
MELRFHKELFFLILSFFPTVGMSSKDKVLALLLKNATQGSLGIKLHNSQILSREKAQYDKTTDIAYQKIHLSWHEFAEDVQTIHFSLIEPNDQEEKAPINISVIFFRKFLLQSRNDSQKLRMHVMNTKGPRDFNSFDIPISESDETRSALELFVDGPHLDMAKIKVQLTSE